LNDRILVLNGMSYAPAVEGLGEIVYDEKDFFNNPDKYKLVLFTGGEDVSPRLYEERSPKGQCWANPLRDAQEKAVFDVALKSNTLMTGICRGVQFLNVMAGGRLMHHISGHSGSRHIMKTTVGGHRITVNSLHHQMVIPSENAEIIAVSEKRLSDIYVGNYDVEIDYYNAEVEAAIFPKIGAFGVQYHPEMMAKQSDGYIYFHNMVRNALNHDWRVFVAAYTEGLDDVHFLKVRRDDSSVSG